MLILLYDSIFFLSLLLGLLEINSAKYIEVTGLECFATDGSTITQISLREQKQNSLRIN